MFPSERVPRRRRNKQRATTLDPTQDLSRYAASVSPSPTDRETRKKEQKRVAKSKSPSGYKPQLKDKIKKKNRKSARRRANSDVDVAPLSRINSNTALTIDIKETSNQNGNNETTKARPMSTTFKAKKKTKKSKRYQSQTPQATRVGLRMKSDDPFNVGKKTKKRNKAKKSSMTPKVSLTSTIEDDVYSFSSDEDIDAIETESGAHAVRSQSARFSAQDSLIRSKKGKTRLSNSKNIAETTRVLNAIECGIKSDIKSGFTAFHNALNKRENRLLDDLSTVYNDRKDELIIIEQKLFENKKKSNAKNIEHEFETHIGFTLDEVRIVQQIKKYGNIEGIMGISDDKKEEEMDDFEGDQVLTMASKQKKILGEIQDKTMEKLDLVILMEKEARKKAKQAAILTKEVDEGLKYIEERTKIINGKIATATPELENARTAVSGINPKDLNEIKSLKAPPVVIENVITATVMILGHKIKTWRDVQKLLSYKFKPQLLNFDTYTLKKETRQKVYKKYAGKDDFNYDRVYEASKVCGNLVLWVLSQIKYSRMLDIIIPLEREIKKLKKDSKRKQKLAKELLKVVNELEENIKLYTDQCNEMIDHIIKSTDLELQQFSDKLQPLNEKFNAILNNEVLKES